MSRKTRKLIWSAPLVAVFAVVGALAIFMAQAPNPAQAHDPPGPVRNLEAEGKSWSEIKLTWKAPNTGGAVTGYRIDVSEDEFVWEALVMNTGNTRTTYTHTGLKGNDTRNYRVFALNAAGAGPSPVGEDASNDLFVSGQALPPEAPGQVRNLRATGVDHEQIDVMWDAPSSTGGAKITRYCLVVGISSAHVATLGSTGCTGTADVSPEGAADSGDATEINGITNTLIAETAPTDAYMIIMDAEKPAGHEGHWPMFEHEGLDAKRKLFYRLYSANSVDPSETATNIVNATTKAAPTPGAPGNLKLVATDTGVNLYWNWPSNALKTPADGFYFQYRSSTVREWSTPPVQAAAAFPAQATHAFADVASVVNPVVADDGPPAVRARKAATYLEYRVMVGTSGKASSSAKIKLVPPVDPDSTTLTETYPTLPPVAELPGKTTAAEGDLEFTSTLRTVTLKWEREGDPAVDPDPAEKLPTGFVIDALMGDSTDTDEQIGFRALQPNTSYTGRLKAGDATSQYIHKGVKPSQDWYYRVFPYSSGNQWYGNPLTLQTMTKDAEAPDQYACSQVSVAPDGPTKITLSWPAPGEDGGSPVIGFLVQVNDDDDGDGSRDSDDWIMAPLGMVDADARSYTYAPTGADALDAGTIRWLRVIVLNSVNTNSDGAFLGTADVSSVCTVKGETAEAGIPGMPDGLVAEPARDAGSLDTENPIPDSERGVLLLWNKPDDPAGDEVTGYVIDRRVRANSASTWGDWETAWAEIDKTATSYTDDEDVTGLDDGEARQYRVFAESGSGKSMYAMVTYPHTAAQPGKPTLSAMKVEAMPGSQIKLTWTAPASGVVDGYIIERRYGDMMMDITGYSGTDGANRNHAFMNYKEWWETLNCDGMLQAANIAPADATDEQKAMYCKRFLATAPSMVPDTDANADKKISDETAMKVKDLFKKRYVVKSDDMGMTMTMFTGMMYTDMDLMENTEYTYRVRAIHGMTAGPWSEPAKAKTDSLDKTLGAPTITSVTVDATDPGEPNIDVAWDNGANALSHMVLLFSTPDYEQAKPIKTSQDDGMTSFIDVAAGTYAVVVVSYNANFDWQFVFTTVTVTAGN